MATRSELYAWLRDGHLDQDVEIGIDIARLNRPGSPVFSVLDNALPAALFALASAGVWISAGRLWGVVAGLASCIALAVVVRPVVLTRLQRRVLKMALAGPDSWQCLWDFGGLSIRMAGRPETEAAASATDWRKFSHRYLRRERRWPAAVAKSMAR